MIPLVDLKAEYQSLKHELDPAVLAVLESGQLVLGPAVERFERAFARFCGTRHAVGLNSGTSALQLSLLAAGVGPGDEVITTPFTFVATVAAIEYTGARPVLVDIRPQDYTINPDRIERAITPRTKAIIPVHLYGQPADMDPILEIARKHGVTLIEDASQAHGAEYRGRRVGSIGEIGCFSFYPAKNLGAAGDAGAVVTNNTALAERMKTLRDWGQARKYEHKFKGFNFRMAGVQGAVLGVKLRHLERWTDKRRALAAVYDAELAGTELGLPRARRDARHVYHLYVVRSSDRESLRRSLQEQAIATGIHYPQPIHLLEAYRDLGHKAGDFPESERAADEVLSLPLYPLLAADQVREVCSAIKRTPARA